MIDRVGRGDHDSACRRPSSSRTASTRPATSCPGSARCRPSSRWPRSSGSRRRRPISCGPAHDARLTTNSVVTVGAPADRRRLVADGDARALDRVDAVRDREQRDVIGALVGDRERVGLRIDGDRPALARRPHEHQRSITGRILGGRILGVGADGRVRLVGRRRGARVGRRGIRLRGRPARPGAATIIVTGVVAAPGEAREHRKAWKGQSKRHPADVRRALVGCQDRTRAAVMVATSLALHVAPRRGTRPPGCRAGPAGPLRSPMRTRLHGRLRAHCSIGRPGPCGPWIDLSVRPGPCRTGSHAFTAGRGSRRAPGCERCWRGPTRGRARGSRRHADRGA
jgi:hypothetical protein